jgi:hypothetical protein
MPVAFFLRNIAMNMQIPQGARWVARLEQDGQLAATIYQAEDGSFFLHRPGQESEPLTEFEVRQLVMGARDRAIVQEACDRVFEAVASLGVEHSAEFKQRLTDRVHKMAREAGIVSTGSAPNVAKFLPQH